MDLYRDEDQKWYDNQVLKQTQKHDLLRRRWIDRILDGGSDELGTNFFKDKRNPPTEASLKAIFEDRLSKDLVEVPHDFYQEELLSEDPNYLL